MIIDNTEKEQMMQSQSYAVRIEHILRGVFACDRGGFGGQIDTDSIRKHPFLSMTQGLAYIYAVKSEKIENIENFITTFSRYQDMSIDDILSFTTNEKTIGIVTFQLKKQNGIEELNYMIDEFEKIIR